MKFVTVAAVLLVSIFATSMALPARLVYKQPSVFNSQSRPARLVHLGYIRKPSSKSFARLTQPRLTHARLTNEETDVQEQQVAEETIAEAYPAEVQDSQDTLDTGDEIPEVPEVPEVPELPEDTPVLEEEVAPVAEDLPSEDVAEPEVPETPVASEPEAAVAEIPAPSTVVLQEPINDDDSNDVPEVSRTPKAAPAPLPLGTYFPIAFGKSNNAAIAIANSFSTGEGGSATSHAIAYGNAPPKSRAGPIRRRH